MDKSVSKRTLSIIGIPTLYAVFLRLFFGIDTWRDLYSVMSISFLFCLPTIVGALTVYFSSVDKVQKFTYRFFIPWICVLIFFVLTLALAWEGWACWIGRRKQTFFPFFISLAPNFSRKPRWQ